jgi:quercetin dioxygenase-like cupin family protein
MSSLHRTISTNDQQSALHIRLANETAAVEDTQLLETNGRNARTILKQGTLRMTLIAIAKNGNIPPHRTNATVTIQVLRGTAQFRVDNQEYSVGTGELLVIASGVEHDVRSSEGTLLLLTVVEEPTSSH